MPGKNVIYNAEVQVSVNEKGILSAAKRVKQASQKMKRDLQLEAGTIKPTKEFRQLGADIKAAEKELQRLNRERDRLGKKHTQSDEYKKLSKDIAIAEKSLDKLVDEQIAMRELGIGPADTHFQRLDAKIEQANASLKRMKADLRGMAETGATDKEAKDWYDVADRIYKAEKELDQYNTWRRENK